MERNQILKSSELSSQKIHNLKTYTKLTLQIHI